MSTAAMEELALYSLDKTADIVGASFPSELGWIAIAVRNETLCGLVFGFGSAEQANEALARYLGVRKSLDGKRRSDVEVDCPQLVHRLFDELQRYSAGEPIDFGDIAVSEEHLTSFGRRIVAACRRIQFGQTQSYGELAAACGSPGAARAVGQVMAKNRYPLVVPCHRVLGAGGRLGGFSAPDGLRMKRRLLSLESDFD